MSGPLWMPLHVADYLKDTRHLSTVEHGAYLLMLMNAWTAGGTLPTDERRLARIAGLDADQWAESGEVLLAFFTLDGGAYRHKRIDAELVRAGRLIEQKRAAGKASAEARARRTEGNGRCNGRSTGVERANQRRGNQSQSQCSVSKDTGAEAPRDPVKELIDEGVALLTKDGSSQSSARSFIGKCRKQSGDQLVRAAFRDAERLNVAEPKAWIAARLRNEGNSSAAFYESIERTYRKESATHG